MSRERQIKGCVLNLNAANPDNTVTGVADKSDYRQAEATYQGGMGVVNDEFVFDGVDDYIDTAASVLTDSPTSYSVAMTVRLPSDAEGVLFHQTSVSTQHGVYLQIQSTGIMRVFWGHNAWVLSTTNLDPKRDGGVHHLTTTWEDGVGAKIYVDGDLVVTNPSTANLQWTGVDRSAVGADMRTSGSEFFNGSILRLETVNRTLSPGEIKNLASDPDYVPFGNYGGEILSIQPQRYLGSGDLLDESGNGNDGTLKGSVAVLGDKLAFNGTSGGVDCGNPLSSFASFSVSCFVDSSVDDAAGYVVAQRGSEALGWWELIRRGSVYRFEVRRGDGGSFFNSPNAPATNVRQHLVGVFTGTDVQLYSDGAYLGQTAFSGPLPQPITPVGIAAIRGGGLDNFNGEIEDVRIFNRVLSLEEVKYLYNNGTPGVEVPNTYGSVGYWSPSYDDAGNGSLKLLDYSGAANVGTLTNMDAATDWVADTEKDGARVLDLDGSDDSITLDPYTPTGLTRTFVINFKSTTASKFEYLYFQDGAIGFGKSSSGHIQLIVANSLNKGWSFSNVQGVGTLQSDQWHTVVVTQGLDGIRWYLDGVLDGQDLSYTGGLGADNSNIYLGQRPGIGYLGGIDDCLIYDRELSQSEISELAASRNPFAIKDVTNLLIPYHHTRSDSSSSTL